MSAQKLYCFVDETGQDTAGNLFLVAVVLKNKEELELTEEKLIEAEKNTGKKQFKWKKTERKIKKRYLTKLLDIKSIRNSIYYSIYQEIKEYTALTSLTIAKVLARAKDGYTVTIIIDGLNQKERERVSKELKKLKIRYRKIRGMKDEQSVFLRLADAIAGFLRESYEKESYTQFFIKQFKEMKVISEV